MPNDEVHPESPAPMPAPTATPERLHALLADESVRQWFATVPDLVSQLADKWGLEVGQPYQRSAVSYTLPATRAGQAVVLKIQWPHDECRFEADALQCWNGAGAIRLLEVDRRRHALLLERCEPGTSLGDADIPDKLGVVSGLLRRLCVSATGPFTTLSQEAQLWRQLLQQHQLQQHRHATRGPVAASLVAQALRLLDELNPSPGTQVLVHQDLHGDNILAAAREPWLAIDPKPLLAEPAFAIVPVVRSFELGHSRRAVLSRLARLCEELGVCRQRAIRWTVVQTVAWNINTCDYPQHLETVAWLLDELCDD